MIHTFNRIIYLSGPMTGIEDYNYPLFDYVSERLRGLGHRVYNPTEHSSAHILKHEGNLKNLYTRIIFASYCSFICLEADTIVLLPDWITSEGVTVERKLAHICGLDQFLWESISDEC